MLIVVGSKAYGLLQNLLAPIKSTDKDFTEIVQVMQNHLNPKLLIIAKVETSFIGENELVSQYLVELCKLSEKCEFGDYLEQVLWDWLVCVWVGQQKDPTEVAVRGEAIIAEGL